MKPAPPHTMILFFPDITLCWQPKLGGTLISVKNTGTTLFREPVPITKRSNKQGRNYFFMYAIMR